MIFVLQSFLSDFLKLILDWRITAALTIIFLFLIEVMDKSLYKKFYNGIKWNLKYAGLSTVALAIIFYNLWIIHPSPPVQVSDSVSVILALRDTHLRSFIFYSALIFYLWRKWGSAIPAFYGGLFGIALIEFSFIPQHLILWHGFLGIHWYLPFVIIMMPWWYDRKKYGFNKKMLLFFCIGVFLQYFSFIWDSQAFTAWQNGVITFNYQAYVNPSLGTWIHEGLDQLMKSVMTIAFCFMELKNNVGN